MKTKDYADQQAFLKLNKAEAQREMEIAEEEHNALSALRRLDVLIGRAKAVEFVESQYSKIAF